MKRGFATAIVALAAAAVAACGSSDAGPLSDDSDKQAVALACLTDEKGLDAREAGDTEVVVDGARIRFYLTAAWHPAESLYGRWAIEISAGASITDWPGGGVIGIHGTNQPWLIGRAVSHGCIRMRNADILRLRRWAKPGTRLRIHA